MSISLRCPGCWAELTIRDDYEGRSIQCPCCKARVEAVAERRISEWSTLNTENQGDVQTPVIVPKPCPLCGNRQARAVTWTWWGSFLGPALFHQVECSQCHYGYNGKTGRSNFLVAATFVIGNIALIGLLAYVILIMPS